jgi:hypothetical protein
MMNRITNHPSCPLLSPTPSDDSQTKRLTPCCSIARMMFLVPSDRMVFFLSFLTPRAERTASCPRTAASTEG